MNRMKIEQVAAQLFTIREALKTPKDIAASMKRIAAIGYKAVQVSGMGPIPEAELVKILAGEGLTCCATHEGNILDAPQAVVDRLSKLNCKYTAVPSPGKLPLQTDVDLRHFISKINEAGRVLREGGKVLTYHNHHVEFKRIGGMLILEAIYSGTDPKDLGGEIDTYWVQYGGGDPAAWCRRLKGRLPLLHMKDYRITADNKPDFAEIGHGNLDWKSIIREADAAGCEWYMVEQDMCPGDPFVSLKHSFDYIKEHLCT